MEYTRARSRTGGARRSDPDEGRRTARVLAAERRIAAVAHLLDDLVRIPGTGHRIGLDPLIGLIPILGDVAGALVAGWIVLESARFGLPAVVLIRMIMYAVVDFAVGLVPILGDVFDVGFKANTRNLELFHRHATDPGASTAGSTALVAGVALVFAGVIWAGLVVISRFWSLVLG